MLTTLSLVIALPFGARLTNQPITGTVVMGATAVAGGIVVFLSVGSPTSGATTPSSRDWWLAALSSLIASALVGFTLQQSALKTGALAAALASSNSMTLLSSVALGLTVFSESLESGAVSTAVVLAGLGLIVTGVVVLARHPPPPRASIRRQPTKARHHGGDSAAASLGPEPHAKRSVRRGTDTA